MRVPGIEPGFSDRQSDVLAIILYPHVTPPDQLCYTIYVADTGLEPVASRLLGEHSDQLS